MSDALEIANRIAGKVYSQFMQQVIEKHVLNDRCGQRVYTSAKKEAELKTKKKTKEKAEETDIRTLYLLSISGKGGWTNNPKKQASYLKNANVTLLDHLLSVTRGALMLAAMDLLLSNKQMDITLLERRLKVIVVIAFLHDLDKMERLKRDQELPLEMVERALIHYGLNGFLGDQEILNAEQVRYLIEHAEDSQAHWHQPTVLPPRDYENDVKNYVKLADKLDGIWQQYGAEGGLKQVVQRLQKDQSLQTELLAQWQTLEIYDPHHPFLLDELQKYLSTVCKRRAKIPPLIEIHQDGRLFMLLPTDKADVIKQEGLRRFCKSLPFSLYLNISTVGVPELINEKPDYSYYKTFIETLDARNLSRIFTIKRFLVETITPYMDRFFGEIGLKPQWPKGTGQTLTLTPYPDPETLKQHKTIAMHFNKAASLALLLNLKMPTNKKVLNYAQREMQLSALVTSLIGQSVPEWISDIDEKARQSRCTLLALWTTALAASSLELEQAIWSDKGLLKAWLEGTETQLGFCAFIEDKGAHIIQAVQQHFQQLMTGEYQTATKGTGHCIFTDKPTKTLITGSMKLHGVKM